MLALVLALTLATEIKPQTPEFLGEDVALLIKQRAGRRGAFSDSSFARGSMGGGCTDVSINAP